MHLQVCDCASVCMSMFVRSICNYQQYCKTFCILVIDVWYYLGEDRSNSRHTGMLDKLCYINSMHKKTISLYSSIFQKWHGCWSGCNCKHIGAVCPESKMVQIRHTQTGTSCCMLFIWIQYNFD
jgi:hypothetical protein